MLITGVQRVVQVVAMLKQVRGANEDLPQAMRGGFPEMRSAASTLGGLRDRGRFQREFDLVAFRPRSQKAAKERQGQRSACCKKQSLADPAACAT
jgi:hypothetical protein